MATPRRSLIRCRDGGRRANSGWASPRKPRSCAASISIRSELDRGDVRAQYLGWLLRLQSGGLGEDDLEPPAPAGLGELTGAQQVMADFLRIDEALLATAAEQSPPVTRRTLKRAEIDRRVHELPLKGKEKTLADDIAGKPSALRRLQDATSPIPPSPIRSVIS